jgi:hypothetical protein
MVAMVPHSQRGGIQQSADMLRNRSMLFKTRKKDTCWCYFNYYVHNVSTTTGKLAILTPGAANLFTAPIANSIISSSPSLKRLLLRIVKYSIAIPKIGSWQQRYKLVDKTVDKCI